MQITQNSHVVTPTIEQQKLVLEKLEELGFVWNSNSKPTDLIPLNYHGNNQVIFIQNDEKRLYYGTVANLKYRNEYPEIPLASFSPRLLL